MSREAPIVRRETQRVLSNRGERYCRAWLPSDPERVMVLVHGYAEHSGRYDEMAMYFARRGFAVHAYDQAGHGRTRGPRGHVDRFTRLPEEAEHIARGTGELPVDIPLVVSNHPDLRDVVPVGDTPGFGAILPGGNVYAAPLRGDNEIALMNTASFDVVGRISEGIGEGPITVAVSPAIWERMFCTIRLKAMCPNW